MARSSKLVFFGLVTRLFSTRSNDLVFFPSFDPFFSRGCLWHSDSLKLSGFLGRVDRLVPMFVFRILTRYVILIFFWPLTRFLFLVFYMDLTRLHLVVFSNHSDSLVNPGVLFLEDALCQYGFLTPLDSLHRAGFL